MKKFLKFILVFLIILLLVMGVRALFRQKTETTEVTANEDSTASKQEVINQKVVKKEDTHVKMADISNWKMDTLIFLFGATNNHSNQANIAVPVGYNTVDSSDKRIFYVKKVSDAGIYTRGTSAGIITVTVQYTKTTN